MTGDRNFDGLAEKFLRNIYGTTKGRLRQLMLLRELDILINTLPKGTLSILDIGGGQGQIACTLAALGHDVSLCDISAEMLTRARSYAKEQNVSQNMHFHHISAQELARDSDKSVDVILCHAVLEWVEKPDVLIAALWKLLAPGGALSLMFYNRHALVLKNMMHANFQYLQGGLRKKKRRSLLPDYPCDPEEIYACLRACGFILERCAGIRVFHDYVQDKQKRIDNFDQILEIEKRYCHEQPFVNLGRYIHVHAKKPNLGG